MRYIAAYMLAVLGGKEQPTVGDLRNILDSVGVEVDETCINLVIQKLHGKDVNELISEGTGRLAFLYSAQKSNEEVKVEPGNEGKDTEADRDSDSTDSESGCNCCFLFD